MQPICCTQSLSSIIISCTTCKSNHHLTCLTNDWIIPPLLCDPLYSLSSCSTCIPNLPPNLFRLALSWSDVLHISLLNLQSQKEPRRRSAEGLAYYHVKLDLTPFIELNWNMFWSRVKHATWRSSMASSLSTFHKFISGVAVGEQGLWALEAGADLVESLKHRNLYSILPNGAFLEEKQPEKVECTPKKRIGDTDLDPSPPKKRQKRKSLPVGNPIIYSADALTMYYDIENSMTALGNGKHVLLSDQPTHTAPQLKVSRDGKSVCNSRGGYRLCKATHGVYQGNWYYEVIVSNDLCNARIGWSQISADLQAPCGYDRFGYSWRARPGTLFHDSDVFVGDEGFGNGFGIGDVVGIGISLPELGEGEVEDLEGRMWDRDAYVSFKRESVGKYAGGSCIRFWKNGVEVGTGFRDLYLGKYHPSVSLYSGEKGNVAGAGVNFGPSFSYGVPEGYRGMCESVDEPEFLALREEIDEGIRAPSIPLDVEGDGDVRMEEVKGEEVTEGSVEIV